MAITFKDFPENKELSKSWYDYLVSIDIREESKPFEHTPKRNNGRSLSQIGLIWPIIGGVIVALIGALGGYYTGGVAKEREISATQTAEIRIMTLTPEPTSTPDDTPNTPTDGMTPGSVPNQSGMPPRKPITGTIWFDPKYGVTFAYVPAGEFHMGSTQEQIDQAFETCIEINKACKKEQFEHETPQFSFPLPDFWIMQYEVTNAQYQQCVQANPCTPPKNDNWNKPENAQRPVTNVSWHQAIDYAKWVGGRLPSEAQWEKAARGPDGRIFPWGNEEPTYLWLNFDKQINQPVEVGHYFKGVSPYNVYDMAGNVWEWTSTLYGEKNYPYMDDKAHEDPDTPSARTLRGGAWDDRPDTVRVTSRYRQIPNEGSTTIGFRVVRLVSPNQ